MHGSDIPCKVIGLTNNLQRASRRRGVAACPPGTRLYYIWHEPTKLYFHECYVSEAYALKKAKETLGPTSMGDVAQSWRPEPKYCQHSWRGNETDS